MIYLDNSATTRKKPLKTIIETVKALTIYSANPSRSSHKASIKTSLKVEECREQIKKLVNAPANASVIYTYNCTEAINFALLGTLSSGDHVVITTFEHNAVLRTLHNLTKIGVTYSLVNANSMGNIRIDEIAKHVNSSTKLIAVNHTSNVTGLTIKLNNIGQYCKENNILFLVDCAQSAGHEIINMQNDNINFVCLAGHKGLYGPQGIGALVCDSPLKAIKFGGSGTESINKDMPKEYPEKLEAGTINTVGIIGLSGGISFVNKHFEKIRCKTIKLTNYLLNFLNNNNKFIIYSNNAVSGVVSFNIKNINNNDVVNILNDDFSICVRGGLHCAPLAHEHLNTIKDGGTVRVSISYFNTLKEIKKLCKALKIIAQNYI